MENRPATSPIVGPRVGQLIDHMKARWHDAARYVIFEATFDGGSNFFATWFAWRADPKRCAQLHYLARIEAGVPVSELLQPCVNIDAWAPLVHELQAILPPALPGFHRLILDHGNVILTLIVEKPNASLSRIGARVDAFILSGELETSAAKALGRLAAPDALLAGENLSNAMQQALQQAGFLFDAKQSSEDQQTWRIARFAPRWRQPSKTEIPERRAIIIGAGLAGSAACERLAARGWQLTLIERHVQPAQEASGNLAGIYMPILSKDDNPTARLTRSAYLFAARMWRRAGGIGHAFAGEACGVLQLARDATHAQAQQELIGRWKYPSEFVQWLDRESATQLLGQSVPNGGLLFPQAGWAHPAGICRALLAACHSQVDMRFEQNAIQLQRIDNQWQVQDANGALIAQAPTVIFANGIDALRFAQTKNLPLTSVRGQVTYVAAESLPDLPVVVCRDGYLTRPSNGMCSVGASYDMDDDAKPRRSSDAENCARLNQMLPDISLNLEHVLHHNRVAFRCVASDRLPLVGALPDVTAPFHGERLRDVPRLPGLYGLLGYASRGLIWSMLAAELLAAQLEGEPLPLESDLVDAIDPARFFVKARRMQPSPDMELESGRQLLSGDIHS